MVAGSIGPDCAQVTEEEQAAKPVAETERAPLGPFRLGSWSFSLCLTPSIMTTQRKAVALISGGLDSMFAAKIILDPGIHVEGVNVFTGFCVAGHHAHAIRMRDRNRALRNHALWVADQLGRRLQIIHLDPDRHPGPMALIDGDTSGNELGLAASSTARSAQDRAAQQVRVKVTQSVGHQQVVSVTPRSQDQLPKEGHV